VSTGPGRAAARDLADDIAAALAANPRLARSSIRWAQFYRKAYLRWIDSTTRRPDLRAPALLRSSACCGGVKDGHVREAGCLVLHR